MEVSLNLYMCNINDGINNITNLIVAGLGMFLGLMAF